MRESVELGELGEVACGLPSNLACLVDLIDEFKPDQSRRHRLRVCASALGIACALEDSPVYSPFRSEVLEHGALMLDYLMRRGVTLGQIAEAGSIIISAYVDELPKESEVTEAEDFSEAVQAAS